MLNNFCSSLEFTLNLLVYYGVLDEGDAQCFALEASIMAGAYLFVPLICCLAFFNAFVAKAYVQHLREKQEEEDEASEDEKLRAFDRTTWDSRADALRNIKKPQVLFTDTFRWTLRRQTNASFNDTWKNKSSPAPQLFEIETMPLANKTSGSDEEHGGGASSTVESLKSEESTENQATSDADSAKQSVSQDAGSAKQSVSQDC